MYHTPLGQARNNLDKCAKQKRQVPVLKGRSSLLTERIANEERGMEMCEPNRSYSKDSHTDRVKPILNFWHASASL